MFDTLLESRRRRERRLAIALGSAAAHAALIGWAALVSARPASPPDRATPSERPIWIPTRPAPPTPPDDRARDGSTGRSPAPTEAPGEIAPPPIDIVLDGTLPPIGPTVDVGAIVGRHDAAGPLVSGAAGGTGIAPDSVFSVDHVDRIAALRPGSPSPRYPEALRAAGVEGRVELRFVVDTLGRVEPGSSTVLSSTDPRFTAAVRATLPRLRFTPARYRGHAVRMLVQMPFVFRLQKE